MANKRALILSLGCQTVPLEIVFHAINRSENISVKFSSTSALSRWIREPCSHKLRWKHHWFLRCITVMKVYFVLFCLFKRIYFVISEKTPSTSNVVVWFYYGLVKGFLKVGLHWLSASFCAKILLSTMWKQGFIAQNQRNMWFSAIDKEKLEKHLSVVL